MATCGRIMSRLATMVDVEGGYFELDEDYRMWAADRILNFENTRTFGGDIELFF